MGGLPTVNDVATAAGVSRQTVSNVLNSPQIVREETRYRVQQAIAQLGYRPHASARRLRTQRSSTLAVRIEPTPDGVSGSVLDRFLHALTEQADGLGLRVMLYAAKDADDEVRAIRRLVQGSDVDAFVLTSTFHGDPRIAWLIEHGQSFVAFGRPWGFQADDERYLWVDVDGRLGVFSATDYLLGQGCRRIAFLGWPVGSGTGDERRLGWRQAMQSFGLGVDELESLTVFSEENLQAGRVAVTALLARCPDLDGIVATSDTLAMAAMATAQGRLPVVGFDNTPVAASLGFSSVDQCLEEVAAHALALLQQAVGDAPSGPT
ncbi:MAG: LacI family transcriptional regulator, partial [Propionibacteriaceae bacterium]|nr:LacI family transcriptional regulator [Propionibacteriaceae bacterium]